MASFGGFPQTVNYQTVNVSSGGGSENLLINPRGKINQLSESDGVLAPFQYFCDGWKAGAAGAEVYRDSDGFRLISGSIVQYVEMNVDAGQVLRGNMDVLGGSPVLALDGGTDTLTYAARGFVDFEVSGDNCKFTNCILAASVSLPIYQQAADELAPCLRYLAFYDWHLVETVGAGYMGAGRWEICLAVSKPDAMKREPAVVYSMESWSDRTDWSWIFVARHTNTQGTVLFRNDNGAYGGGADMRMRVVLDARI